MTIGVDMCGTVFYTSYKWKGDHMKRVYVHRRRDGHADRRKQLRRAAVDGVATIVEQDNNGWLYQVPDNFKVKQS